MFKGGIVDTEPVQQPGKPGTESGKAGACGQDGSQGRKGAETDDEMVRRRIFCIQLKHWKIPGRLHRELKQLGLRPPFQYIRM